MVDKSKSLATVELTGDTREAKLKAWREASALVFVATRADAENLTLLLRDSIFGASGLVRCYHAGRPSDEKVTDFLALLKYMNRD